jgi:hypothetical protein
MTGILRIAGQFAVILALFSAVSVLASWPPYRQIPEGHAVVMLSFVYGADRRLECRKLTSAEVAKLPPNMRRVQECPRGRRSIGVELDLDGRTIFQASLPPTGIAGDGPSKVYERFLLPAGEHDIAVRMRDTARVDGFDHAHKERVALTAGQMLVIDFRSEGGFVFR